MTKISQLSDVGGSLAAGDEFVIRDVSDISTPNKKVTASGFADYIISQGTGSGFSQIAAGAGPAARVQTTASGSDGTISFQTNGSERARIDSTGQVRLAGAGITFNGDTATANELDDYEEGTWTPSLGGTATYTSRPGTYTKVGRVVTVYCQITVNAIGTGSTATITGLPFDPVTKGWGSVYWDTAATSMTYSSARAVSPSTITLYSGTAATASLSSGTSVFGNGTIVELTLTYTT